MFGSSFVRLLGYYRQQEDSWTKEQSNILIFAVMHTNKKPFLKEIAVDRGAVPANEFPFNIAAIQNLRGITLHENITFFVGENGMGKSLLVEGIAAALGYGVPDATHTSPLQPYLRLGKGISRPDEHDFLPAESFYHQQDRVPHRRRHGEAFMTKITHQLQGNGLYIFDEPETALSPSRQLNALIAIHELVKKNSQFIIATHSPILIAYPKAKIYRLDKAGINEVWYENTDHHRVSKEFMNYPDEMTRILLK